MTRSRSRKFALSLVTALLLLLPSLTAAQEPVVYGVFFFSPTCPHCIDVLTNHWPGIQNEFGDQLRVMFIDATSQQGGQLMLTALDAMGIPSSGVPMLIIGDNVLVGSSDIPLRAATIIREGLASGGIGLPSIPGIDVVYQAALAQSNQVGSAVHTNTQATAAPTEVEAVIDTNIFAEPDQTPTFAEQLAADPVANGLAIVVLVLLALSFLMALPSILSLTAKLRRAFARLQPVALVLVSLIGLGLALTLLAGSGSDPLVLLLAAAEFIVFIVIVGAILWARRQPAFPTWLVPLTAVSGLAVAGYLAYVELTLNDAVCGVVGNCNTVQQSVYAQIFGIPIGVLGIAGYLLILVTWLLSRADQRQASANKMLQALALFGVAFSIYLTFLEPFVIGATCVWCLTSAVIMLLLLWLVTPSAPEPKPERSQSKRLA